MAKQTILDWIVDTNAPDTIRIAETEHTGLPALLSGKRVEPDVYVEFTNGTRVAFECQRSPMGGISRFNTATRFDGRAEWQRRLDEYTELNERCGVHLIWLVSPWTASIEATGKDTVHKVYAYGTWASERLTARQRLYGFDPSAGQVGTLTKHIRAANGLPGFITEATSFRRRGEWSWLHADPLQRCGLDPHTGAFITPTDREIRKCRPTAEQRQQADAQAQQDRARDARHRRDQQAARFHAEQEQRRRDAEQRRAALAAADAQRQHAAAALAAAEAAAAEKARAAAIERAILTAAAAAVVLVIAFLIWLHTGTA